MLELIVFVGLLGVGYFAGRSVEQRHYRSIRVREKASLYLPTVTARMLPEPEQIDRAFLVSGSCVISIDFFKRVLAGLRNISGGRIASYENLLDRARREAILRMKEEARGCHLVVNARVETATVFGSAEGGGVGSLEVLAYGTALKLRRDPIRARVAP